MGDKQCSRVWVAGLDLWDETEQKKSKQAPAMDMQKHEGNNESKTAENGRPLTDRGACLLLGF